MTNIRVGSTVQHEGKLIKESEFKWIPFSKEAPAGNRLVVIMDDVMDCIITRPAAFPKSIPSGWYVWAYLPDVPEQEIPQQ